METHESPDFSALLERPWKASHLTVESGLRPRKSIANIRDGITRAGQRIVGTGTFIAGYSWLELCCYLPFKDNESMSGQLFSVLLV